MLNEKNCIVYKQFICIQLYRSGWARIQEEKRKMAANEICFNVKFLLTLSFYVFKLTFQMNNNQRFHWQTDFFFLANYSEQ